jgi:HEAT repeat protein
VTGQLPQLGVQAVAGLLEALRDEAPSVRKTAATNLGRLGPKAIAALPALTAATGDPEVAVRKAAVGALGELGLAAVPALALALNDESVSLQATEAIAKYAEAAWELLFQNIGKPLRPAEGMPAIVIPLPEQAAALVQALEQGPRELQLPAIACLSSHAAEPAIAAALRGVLSHSNEQVALAAATALVHSGNFEAR